MEMRRLVYSKRFDSILLRICTDCKVVVPYDPFAGTSSSEQLLSYSALWDTGATITCVSSRVIEDLQLIPLRKTILFLASGETETEEYAIDLVLPNGVRYSSVRVIRTEGPDDVTIGMDIIAMMDFAITHPDGGTLFSFQIPPSTSIDFSKY